MVEMCQKNRFLLFEHSYQAWQISFHFIIADNKIYAMNKQFSVFFLSLLVPGIGYLKADDRKSFFKTVTLFFGVIIIGVVTKLFTTFLGLALIIASLIAVYIFAAINATFKTKEEISNLQVNCFRNLSLI